MRRWLPILILLFAPVTQAAEPFRYPEGKHGKAELKYINDLPVLTLEGTPEEIGEQIAMLTSKSATKLLDYPRDILRRMKLEAMWPVLVLAGKSMVPHFPPDYVRELDASVKTISVDRDALIVGNTMFDVMKVAACATLFVDAEHSTTHAPLLGRNLDYPTLGYLEDYSMVIVVRPKGKHAFASVGFPGILGCLSGMNDAGLCLAVLECYAAKDGAAKFNAKGTPYAMCYRRILEECTTIEEAEKLLRSMSRTTMNNLAVCDKKGGAVFEITPNSVVVRRPEHGMCPCTNHFRTAPLAASTKCWRYSILEKNIDRTLGLADIAEQLHLVNQGKFTFQTMVFEPIPLKLHLAIGKCPSSALPMKELDLRALLERGRGP